MRVAIIGRTEVLLETASRILDAGHQIPLIVTAKAAPEYEANADDFCELARDINAEFLQTSKLNHESNLAKVRNLLPLDVGVSMNYTNVIHQQFIDLFDLGVLNAHGGDLPRYRGNACQAWAIINGEDKVGLCVHKMIGGELDSGDIVTRKYLPIDLATTIGDIQSWMGSVIPGMFLEALSLLDTNPEFALEVQSKNPEDSLRCYPRIPSDGRINWLAGNEDIVRLINASSAPYEGAYCRYDGRKVTVWKAETYQDDERYLAVPGQVSAKLDDGTVVVICGRGKIRIKELSVDDVKVEPAKFLSSIRKRLE